MKGFSPLRKVGWGFGLCNMNCAHCYNNSDLSNEIPRYTFGQLVDIADKLCPSIRDINFGTGELLCNPNAMKLVHYITDSFPHIDIAITSNGYTILGMNKIDIKRRLSDVDISIDFPDEERHNNFRGHSDAWRWANQALSILQDVRIQRTITMCVTSLVTDDDLLKMLRLANRYGACLRLNWFRFTGRGPESLRVSAKRAWQIIEFLSDKAVFTCLDSVFAGPLGVRSCTCTAGKTSARIHQDMSVTAYPFLSGNRWSAGNILDPKVDLSVIYSSNVFENLRNRIVIFCQGCDFEKTCAGGCVTRAILHNGGIGEVDDFCPVISRQMRVVEKLQGKIVLHKHGNLVHEGYLCTTIMKPNLDV